MVVQIADVDDADTDRSNPLAPPPTLKRVLGLWLLVFYGLGNIIGAGIYVLIGAVADVAGYGTPLAFIIAGALAAMTGLSYAELSARYPEAAGAAAYVQEAFNQAWLSRVVGFAVVAVGVFLAASLAHGATGYVAGFVALPKVPMALGLIVLCTLIAAIGVSQAVKLAALLTVVELAGLVIVVAAGAPSLTALPEVAAQILPTSEAAVFGLVTGSFLAFFAFLGFEDIVNMAEETRDPARTLPSAIILAIVLSTALYGMIAVVVITALPLAQLRASQAPLELIMRLASWAPEGMLSAIALVAIPNGILITVVMLARLVYGMARRGWVPARLGQVNRLTRTPLRATFLAGGVVLLFTATIDFIGLVRLTSAVNLSVFTIVNMALWRLQRVTPRADLNFQAPPWCPPTAAAFSLALLLAALSL